MRIGGLATGMDTDQLVAKLMEAHRLPLTKMQQDRTVTSWKRDAYRDVNKLMLELDKAKTEMKLDKSYQPKTVTSSNDKAITAKANGDAIDGVYDIKVTQIAKNAINVGGKLADDTNPEAVLVGIDKKEYFFSTYNEAGSPVEHKFEVKEGDTLNSVLKRISDDPSNNVRAFYDKQTKSVVLETTRTGKYNPANDKGANPVAKEDRPEIVFNGTNNSFFTGLLQLDSSNEEGGENAEFIYNGSLTLESTTNNYNLNGITFDFKSVTETSEKLTIANDVDAAFNSIMKFVDKYNETIDKLNAIQKQEKYRSFKPLSDDEKKDMKEDQIKQWEEKAKSGLLRGDSTITSGLNAMRNSLYSTVQTDGAYNHLTKIGLGTSKDYLSGGKIVFSSVTKPDGSVMEGEAALREALQKDPASVKKLFVNNESGGSPGLINKLEKAITDMGQKIAVNSGNQGFKGVENADALGEKMKDFDKRISAFERRLTQVETRYWNQFNAMEKAISQMNQQSASLMQQFGG